jgi:alpha-tubulin suppressor-like RCC1 family protein
VQIGTGYASVAAGRYHSAGLKTDGTLWTWGANYTGQLGDGTTTPRSVPVQVGTGYAFLAAGDGHIVAVKTDGTVWTWGDDLCGQLGVGDGLALLPRQVP